MVIQVIHRALPYAILKLILVLPPCFPHKKKGHRADLARWPNYLFLLVPKVGLEPTWA